MNLSPLLLLGLFACASRTLVMPGPLGPVAQDRPPPVPVTDLPRATQPTPTPAPGGTDEAPADDDFGKAVARAAVRNLKTLPDGFRNDCSGFVMAAHARAGLPLSGSTRHMWEQATATDAIVRRPEPGDVAFFDNTYDRNRNGRRDDPLTHVAVVLSVETDGTLLLAHGGTSRGRTELRMNLDHPDVRTGPDGTVYNDWLRARRKGDGPNAKLLAGELFRGFARFRPGAS